MLKGSMTFGSKEIPITLSTRQLWTIFLIAVVPSLMMGSFVLFLVGSGLYKFGGVPALVLTLLLLGQVTFTKNGVVRKFSIIRNEVFRGVVGTVVFLAAGLYGLIHLFF